MISPHSPRLDRRGFLAGTAAVAALALGSRRFLPAAHAEADAFTLPALPYERTALQPVIGGGTIDVHYGKHHATYVKNLNDLTKGKPHAGLALEAVVKASAGKPDEVAVFNNAAQVWNHTFYWNSMKPQGGGAPSGALLALIAASFGDLARFKAAFIAAGKARFGSGWIWLVHERGQLALETTANADTPLARGQRCLLTCDVWEHAYYLDHQARRADYVSAFLERLVDWDFASRNLSR